MDFVIVGDVALVALLCCVATATTAVEASLVLAAAAAEASEVLAAETGEVLAAEASEVLAAEAPVQWFYHESEGIPKAAAIKEREALLPPDAENDGGGDGHPYLANMLITLTTGATSMCGSSLLNANRLVTAAHCWFDGRSQARELLMVFGSQRLYSGGVRVATSNVQMHSSWNADTRNDIAIIRMPTDIVYTNNIQPVALPTGAMLNEDFVGKSAVAAELGISDGAGISNNFENQDASMQVITNNECRKWYANVVDSMLCSSDCGGVSGGPLTITIGNQSVLIGVTSFGTGLYCQNGLPVAFVRVTSFVSWIREHV